MRVTVWGARGSLPTPGPATVRFGGNTSCFEIVSPAGTRIIIDCGTGIRQLGGHLAATEAGPLKGHILISHTHWDHIQGIPFFGPFFVPANEWDVYAPKGLHQSLRNVLEGQMQYSYFPLQLDELGANIRFHELVEGTFQIADVAITTRYLNHPALTFGYRLEAGDATIVYASDHEPHSRVLAGGTGEITGEDLRHCQFLSGADLVIHDAQYTAAEYPRKIGWGHSTFEYALAVCRKAGVKQVCLTHHDPARDDAALDRLVTEAQAHASQDTQVIAAQEGASLIVGGGTRHSASQVGNGTALAEDTALGTPLILAALADQTATDVIRDAAQADGFEMRRVHSSNAVLDAIHQQAPALVILEQQMDGLEVCAKLRHSPGGRQVPVIMLADAHDQQAGMAAGVTDWLLRPFSSAYARTKMRAWLLRTTARWARPPVPADEVERLAALYRLGILDTPQEHRFDVLTRLAAAVAQVPIALVSFVDRERQWFKSAHGLSIREGPRETSFCGHAVAAREMLVVPDALADERFADNPDVAGNSRLRFYAGVPLFVEQRCVGTLCVLDTNPRQLSRDQMDLLKEIAGMVESELQ